MGFVVKVCAAPGERYGNRVQDIYPQAISRNTGIIDGGYPVLEFHHIGHLPEAGYVKTALGIEYPDADVQKSKAVFGRGVEKNGSVVGPGTVINEIDPGISEADIVGKPLLGYVIPEFKIHGH